MAPRREARRATKAAVSAEPASLSFSRVNGMLGVAGLASVVLGYWLLANGSVTAAPLLLVLGYAVLLPLAIIL
ncbi:MAG TPA: hypothetical protein VGA70_01360 [Longimicrobiales bacterium]|jgi:hypothetical protein